MKRTATIVLTIENDQDPTSELAITSTFDPPLQAGDESLSAGIVSEFLRMLREASEGPDA